MIKAEIKGQIRSFLFNLTKEVSSISSDSKNPLLMKRMNPLLRIRMFSKYIERAIYKFLIQLQIRDGDPN